MANNYVLASIAFTAPSIEAATWLKDVSLLLPSEDCDEEGELPEQYQHLLGVSSVADLTEQYGEALGGDDDYVLPGWDVSLNLRDGYPPAVYISSEESGDVGALACILERYLFHFDPEGVIHISWAETCSKPRVNEFGGGACVIRSDGTTWMNTGDWLNSRPSIDCRNNAD